MQVLLNAKHVRRGTTVMLELPTAVACVLRAIHAQMHLLHQ